MIPVVQTRTGYGTGTCWSAAIGSILNLGFEVPPFVPDAYRRHGDMLCSAIGDARTKAWLAEAGYDLDDLGPTAADFEAGEVTLNTIRDRNNDLDWVLMIGNSPRLYNGVPIVHVVCVNLWTAEIWDPHPSQAGLTDWFNTMAIRPSNGMWDD